MLSIDDFVSSANRNLSEVQKLFDEYQKKNFPERSPEFFCLELNGEAGELANAEKKRWKGNVVPHEIFQDEAADVLIALMNYVNSRNIDLGEAVRTKLLTIEKKRQELAEKGLNY
jgi:NTP pyrophosphatase (non-canonical NTP hydrolase)